jgi:hypothetical protein
MLAAVEAAEAADVGCKRRRSPAMTEENPGGDAAEESIGSAVRKEGCTAGEEESWTAGAAEFKDVCGGCSIEEGRLRGCEKSRFNLF